MTRKHTHRDTVMPSQNASAEPNGTLLTVQDVAKRWKTSRATIYRAIHSGRLKSVRLGRALTRFRHDDVLDAEKSA
jgi:excisionase family DNA binding protein